MGTKYFLMFPPGTPLVRGPVRCDPYSGWVEADGFSLKDSKVAPIGHGAGVGPGKIVADEFVFSRKPDPASAQLRAYSNAALPFKVIVVDVWDEASRTSKATFEFRPALISRYDGDAVAETYTVSFKDMTMKLAGGTKTAAINPAAIKMALARAAW